jgi:hypothetical protein
MGALILEFTVTYIERYFYWRLKMRKPINISNIWHVMGNIYDVYLCSKKWKCKIYLIVQVYICLMPPLYKFSGSVTLWEHQGFQQIIGIILPTLSIKSLSHGKKKTIDHASNLRQQLHTLETPQYLNIDLLLNDNSIKLFYIACLYPIFIIILVSFVLQ